MYEGIYIFVPTLGTYLDIVTLQHDENKAKKLMCTSLFVCLHLT